MFNLHYHRRKDFKKTTKLIISRFFSSIGIACIIAIFPIVMESYSLSNSTIGFLSAFLVMISLLFSLKSTVILEKFNLSKIYMFSVFIISVLCLILWFYQAFLVFLLCSIIMVFMHVLRYGSFDILFRDTSKLRELNSNKGMLYSIINVGWLIGPLITSYFIFEFGVDFVWLASSFFIFLGLFLFFRSNVFDLKKRKEKFDDDIIKNLKSYFSSKKHVLPYLIVVGLEIWWSLIYIYIPLAIIDSGLGVGFVGIFLALNTLPLIFLEFEVGKWSEKYGFKRFFVWGFFFLGILSLLTFFSHYHIYIVLGLMILSGFFASMIEPLYDSYFFKNTRKQDEEKFYPIYATSADIGGIIGKLSVAGVILFLPFHFSYLTIAFFMFIMVFVSLNIRD